MKVTIKQPPPSFNVADIVRNIALGAVFIVTEILHDDDYAATILQTQDHLLRVGENTTFTSSARFEKLPVGETITIDGNDAHIIEWRNPNMANRGYYLVDVARDPVITPNTLYDLTVLIEYTQMGKSMSQGMYFTTANEHFYKFTGTITLENE